VGRRGGVCVCEGEGTEVTQAEQQVDRISLALDF
jgi:hypothetical protein